MSINLPSLYAQQFATNIQLLVQQKESRLRSAVSFKSGYVGKQVSPVDQVGLIEMQPVVSRFAPMGRVDAPNDRRWVIPLDFDLPQLIDSFDKLRLLVDPESPYVQAAVAAANRKMDDLIIAAFHASAMTGIDGTTATTLPAGQVVSVSLGGTTSGLNVDKIKRGVRILRANEVGDAEQVYCAITAQDEEALLSEITVINRDYTDMPILQEGKLTRWYGVNFIHSERILSGTDDAAGISRSLPMWVPSGMHLAMWNDMETSISKRNDLQGEPWQAYVKMTANATRIEEKKVVRIWAR